MPQLAALKLRVGALREAKEQTMALHSTFFNLHLADEIMQTHKIMNDLSVRIEQLEILIKRYESKSQE